MIHWRSEGGLVHQGLNIYPFSDPQNAGGCLRIGNRMWRVRYSKFFKKWHFNYHKVDPNALKDWEQKHGLKHE